MGRNRPLRVLCRDHYYCGVCSWSFPISTTPSAFIHRNSRRKSYPFDPMCLPTSLYISMDTWVFILSYSLVIHHWDIYGCSGCPTLATGDALRGLRRPPSMPSAVSSNFLLPGHHKMFLVHPTCTRPCSGNSHCLINVDSNIPDPCAFGEF